MMHYHRVDVAGYDRPVLIKKAYLASEDTTKVATTRYLPGHDTIATAYDQDVVNTYVAPMHKATSERPDVFLDHLDYLLPDDVERKCFLYCLRDTGCDGAGGCNRKYTQRHPQSVQGHRPGRSIRHVRAKYGPQRGSSLGGGARPIAVTQGNLPNFLGLGRLKCKRGPHGRYAIHALWLADPAWLQGKRQFSFIAQLAHAI